MNSYKIEVLSNKISYIDIGSNYFLIKNEFFNKDDLICEKNDLISKDKFMINKKILFKDISNKILDLTKFNYISSIHYLDQKQRDWILTSNYIMERFFSNKKEKFDFLFSYENNPWKKILEEKKDISGLVRFENGVFCDINYIPIPQAIYFDLKDILKYFNLLQNNSDKIDVFEKMLLENNINIIKNNSENENLVIKNIKELDKNITFEYSFCFIPNQEQMNNIYSYIINNFSEFNYPFYSIENIKKSIVNLGYIECLNLYRSKEEFIMDSLESNSFSGGFSL